MTLLRRRRGSGLVVAEQRPAGVAGLIGRAPTWAIAAVLAGAASGLPLVVPGGRLEGESADAPADWSRLDRDTPFRIESFYLDFLGFSLD